MPNTSQNGTVYTLTGKTDAPVIALIHGLGLTRATWNDYLPILEQHYQVLNYDLYGHGESAQPPEQPSLTLFARQLRELMDELEIEAAALIGFSLGGMINRRFAMDYPDRVYALGILNSPHERSPEGQKLVEERAAKTDAGGPGATLDATIERWFTPEFREQRDDIIQNIRGWVLANNPESYTQCRWVLAAGVIELIRPEPPIGHPTLIITCENDSGSTPAMSEAIGSEIEGAEVIIIPRLQHMGLVEQPEAFSKPLLEFLSTIL
ncbi:MAG: alpha/beta fold hydrolase [Thiolinea sp.]